MGRRGKERRGEEGERGGGGAAPAEAVSGVFLALPTQRGRCLLKLRPLAVNGRENPKAQCWMWGSRETGAQREVFT